MRMSNNDPMTFIEVIKLMGALYWRLFIYFGPTVLAGVSFTILGTLAGFRPADPAVYMIPGLLIGFPVTNWLHDKFGGEF